MISGPGSYSPTDGVGNAYYLPHLNPGFKSNGAISRAALLERMYQRLLSEAAMSRFQWEGLPDSVNPRFLELSLYYQGLSVFYWDARYDKFLSLQGTPSGMPNMELDPTTFTVVGNQFVSITLPASKCVPIWANSMRSPDIDIVMLYASKLADLDRTIEINAHNARRNKVVYAQEQERLSIVNIDRQMDEGVGTIKISDAAILDGFGAIDLGIDPNSLEKLHILRTRLWNEALGLLGINGANQDKKERLVSDEVAANDDQVVSIRAANLDARRYAIDLIKKKWPVLDGLSVDYRDSAAYGMPSPMDEMGIEGDDNGDVYNGTVASDRTRA